jgi:hypothetical protein
MVFLFKSLNKPFYFNRKLVKYQVIDGKTTGHHFKQSNEWSNTPLF